MNKELHVVPNNMVLLFVFIEAVLLPIQFISFQPTNKAFAVLILIEIVFLLSDLGELVDDDGSDDLVHDDFDDEEIAEVDEHILYGHILI